VDRSGRCSAPDRQPVLDCAGLNQARGCISGKARSNLSKRWSRVVATMRCWCLPGPYLMYPPGLYLLGSCGIAVIFAGGALRWLGRWPWLAGAIVFALHGVAAQVM
jgi:hypothetical protein